MMGKTVFIVGSGNAIVEKAIAKAATAANEVMVIVNQSETYPFTPDPHAIRRYEEALRGAVELPIATCKKHHEYKHKRTEEISPNMFMEVWACIHCGKELK